MACDFTTYRCQATVSLHTRIYSIGTCLNPPPPLQILRGGGGGGDQELNQRDQERQETIEEEAAVKNVDGLTEKNTKMSDSA